MQVGTAVEWCSQSKGSGFTRKEGAVVIVVPPSYRGNVASLFRSKGLDLSQYNTAKLTTKHLERTQESYIIAVKAGKTAKAKPLLYWPRVSDLHIVQGGK